MPVYRFINPETSETVDIIQGMKEPHTHVDGNGLEWEREWSVPNAAVDSEINPENKSDYLRKTENKHMTVGDMMDQNKAMGEKRARLHGGEDPVRKKYFKEWSKKRKGKKHPEDPKGKKKSP